MTQIVRQSLILLVLSIVFVPAIAHAKRGPRPIVLPVDFHGVRYTAQGTGTSASVGAFDIKTGRLLWEVVIFKIILNPLMEEDVQTVFIEAMFIKDAKLIVVAENGRAYSVDLQSHAVRRLWRIPDRARLALPAANQEGR